MLTRDPLGWLRPDDGDPRVVVVPAHSSRMGTFFSAPSPRAPVWHTTDTAKPAALSPFEKSEPVNRFQYLVGSVTSTGMPTLRR